MELKHTSFKIRNAVRYLNAGQVIAYPTEAVYGLGCDPLNESAVMRLLEIKRRPVEKGLILIASSLAQIEPFLALTPEIVKKITATWPGPVTWVIPAQDWVPRWLTGEHDTLAVRVTAHPVAAALCKAYGGALVSTSANETHKPAIRDSRKIIQAFGNQDIFIVHGNVGQLGQETAIYDAVTGRRFR